MARKLPYIMGLDQAIAAALKTLGRQAVDSPSRIRRHASGYYLLSPVVKVGSSVTEWARWDIRGGGGSTYSLRSCYVVEDGAGYANKILEVTPDGTPHSVNEFAFNISAGGQTQDVGDSNGHGNVSLTSFSIVADGVDVSSMSIGDEEEAEVIAFNQVQAVVAESPVASYGTLATVNMDHTLKSGALSIGGSLTPLKVMTITGFAYWGMGPFCRFSDWSDSVVFDHARFLMPGREAEALGSSNGAVFGILDAAGAEMTGPDGYRLGVVMPDWWAICNGFAQNQTNKTWLHDYLSYGTNGKYGKVYLMDLETGASITIGPDDQLDFRNIYVIGKD